AVCVIRRLVRLEYADRAARLVARRVDPGSEWNPSLLLVASEGRESCTSQAGRAGYDWYDRLVRSSAVMPVEASPQRKRLTEDVKETLLGWIRDGKFPPGSQLPSVPELVRKLDVSRTVIREALQAMVGMSLIEIRPGLGCFVKSVPSELVV